MNISFAASFSLFIPSLLRINPGLWFFHRLLSFNPHPPFLFWISASRTCHMCEANENQVLVSGFWFLVSVFEISGLRSDLGGWWHGVSGFRNWEAGNKNFNFWEIRVWKEITVSNFFGAFCNLKVGKGGGDDEEDEFKVNLEETVLTKKRSGNSRNPNSYLGFFDFVGEIRNWKMGKVEKEMRKMDLIRNWEEKARKGDSGFSIKP